MTKKIKELTLLTREEKHLFFDVWNDTSADYPRDSTLPALFELQVSTTPDRLAIVEGDQTLTYQELNGKVNRLARVLRKAGVNRETIVAVHAPRSVDHIIGTLAALKAGGAYMPLDPKLPKERKQYILEDSKPLVLLTTDSDNLPDFQGSVLRLDDLNVALESEENLERVNEALDLANIMYTSGTTGNPKGVEIVHRGIIRLVKNVDYLPQTGDMRQLQTGAVNFDAMTFELWGSLLNGGTLHIVPEEQFLDPAELRRYLKENQINTLFLTTALFQQIAEQDASIFTPLTHLLTGGEALTQRHVRLTLEACPDVTLFNAYGPTENSAFSTVWKTELRNDGKVPIGRPIPNSTVYLVDRFNRLTPMGAAGEVCVGGDGLARGYLNRPEQTAEKFIELPELPGVRVYKTGDLARWLPDGTLEYLGRLDDQVKIRGFRIELGEIENKLTSHAAVKEAVVMARTFEGRREKQLIAYFTTREELSVQDLRAYLQDELPDYMIPAYMMHLDEMPLTRNSKIDRRALPTPELMLESNQERIEARTETERRLVALFEKNLGVDGISVTDHYYHLGGNSLSATLMVSDIQQEFGVKFALSKLLINQTVEAVAKEIEKAERAEIAIRKAQEKELYQASTQQKRLFIEQQMNEEITHYNIKMVVNVPSEVDAGRLQEAINKVIARHEVFRTAFVEIDQVVYQKILDEVVFAMDADLEGLQRPFDLSAPPLLRAALLQKEQGTSELHLIVHHVITDGFSAALFFEEVAAAYTGQSLPEVRLQYKDYSEWWNSGQGAKLVQEQEGYWLRMFEQEVPALDLPTDFKRQPVREYEGEIIEHEIDQQLTQKLRQLAASEQATLFHVVVAAYTLLLSKLTGEKDIVVGTPVSGRNLPGLDSVMGMFVNTLCLRHHVQEDLTFREFLQEVKEQAIEAFDHQDYPFDELVKRVVSERDYSRNPLFDTMIALQNTSLYDTDFLGGQVRLASESLDVMFDLNMQIYEQKDTLLIAWEYASKLFTKETMRELLQHFMEVVTTVVEQPDLLIEQVNLSSQFETADVDVLPEVEFSF